MMLAPALRNVVSVSEPEDVHRLSLIVNTEPQPQPGEVRLDRRDTKTEPVRRAGMGTGSDIRAQYLKLAVSRR